MQNKAELIFMKWKAELADMDRSKPAVEGNFDLLFDQFDRAKIKMDVAMEYLDKATKAHYPSDFMIKRTYQRSKSRIPQSLQEFEKSWKEFIADTAKRVFFCFYEIEGTSNETSPTLKGMSRSEYVKLQRYADSHETVDWEAIIREREAAEAQQEDEPDIDLDSVDINIDLGEL